MVIDVSTVTHYDDLQTTDQPHHVALLNAAASRARRRQVSPDVELNASTDEPQEYRPRLFAEHESSSEANPMNVLGMKKWEGKVLALEDGIFSAELMPLRREDGPIVVADFELELLGPDADSVQPGDVFYLTVRTVGEPLGYKTRTVSLKLRRLGKWSADDLSNIRYRAKRRLESLECYFD